MQKVTGSTPVTSTKDKNPPRGFLFMEFSVYDTGQYYVGHAADLNDRLFLHSNSGSKAPKKVNDWKLIYTEIFQSKAEGSKREVKYCSA